MNNVTNYSGYNLANLYLTIRVSKCKQQKLKLFDLLQNFIKLEDKDVFKSVWYIYKFGINFYKRTIELGVPDVKYLLEYHVSGEDDEEE